MVESVDHEQGASGCGHLDGPRVDVVEVCTGFGRTRSSSAANPRPIAVFCESIKRTRSPNESAAFFAASQVPDNSRDRCTATTPSPSLSSKARV